MKRTKKLTLAKETLLDLQDLRRVTGEGSGNCDTAQRACVSGHISCVSVEVC